MRLTGFRSDGCVLLVNMDSRGGGSEGQDCFPLSRRLVQRPVPRSDDDRPTGQSGWPPVEVVAVLVDVTLDTVDIPAPAGEADANGGAGDRPVSVRRAAWAGLDFCDSMVGGLTFAFLDGADRIMDLAGDVAVGVVSSSLLRWHLWSLLRWHPRLLLGWRPRPLLRWRPRPLLRWHPWPMLGWRPRPTLLRRCPCSTMLVLIPPA